VERTSVGLEPLVGELQAALADCNEALRLKPNVAATLDSRGLTYLKMGQWDSAIDDYSSALRLDPKLASSLYGRGLAKLKKGDTAGGNADIAEAKAIEANIVEDFARYGVQ
jgi:tetratricopeptide (TPR) repeat protein